MPSSGIHGPADAPVDLDACAVHAERPTERLAKSAHERACAVVASRSRSRARRTRRPPTRATVSASRTMASNRLARVFSTTSPARCPRTSLTSLNPSRSTAISVNGSPERRERRNACSMRSSSSTRFGRPVSGSRRASECAVSTRRLRRTPAAAATNAQSDERGDDVVGGLAKDGREEARDEHQRGQAERPHERASQLPPPCSDRHSSPFCPGVGRRSYIRQ